MIIGYSMNFFSNFSFSTDVAVSHLKGTHAFFFSIIFICSSFSVLFFFRLIYIYITKIYASWFEAELRNMISGYLKNKF